MSIQRRFLPSISSLRALEAVDRLGSTIAAADDLSLTHSAVSRQLKTLQDQLGVTLLVRTGKGLQLTSAGESYVRAVRDTLDDLAQASLRLRAAGETDSLNLASPASFAIHWLGPRLQEFLRRNPDILINQSTRQTRFDFSREKFDLAVHFGTRDWPGVDYLALARDVLVPVASPALLPPGLRPAEEILTLPLLHLENRPGAWESWFEHQGTAPGHLRGMLFDLFLSLAEAAVAGLGVALLPDFLARKEIAQGRLFQIGEAVTDPGNLYYLVWPRHGEIRAPQRALIDHLHRVSEVPDEIG